MCRFLFIHAHENQAYGKTLQYVLAPYGNLDLYPWETIKDLDLNTYTLVFLDASILADLNKPKTLEDFISQLSSRWPDTKIIILTTSPTWRRARAALQAGAVDYIRLTLDENLLSKDMEAAISFYILEQKNKIRRRNEEKNNLVS